MEQKQEELIDIKTIIYFLFGHRESILKVANCRDSFKLSFFMVMTAALARSYDKESLFQEPFHLILSPLASAFVALIIFLAFRLLLFRKSLECPPLWRHFRLFLTLFWMTAPLAWIYGFPVEQFLGPILAARVNLYFLGIVALWRVILFIRICQCYFGGVALTTVLLVCSSIAATLLNVIPMPIISVMGGVNIEGADALINLSAMLILALSLMSLPVLSFLYLIFLIFGIGIIYEEPPSAKRVVMDWQVYKIPKLLNILFILLLPVFQPQQAKRFEVIRLFKQGQYKEAIQFLQEAKVSDFPRYWTPPPKWRYRKNDLDMLKILEILQSSEKDSWVKDSYYGQIDAYLRYTYRFRKIEDCSRAHRYYKVMQKIKDAEKFKYLMKRIQDECFDNSDQNSESKIIN